MNPSHEAIIDKLYSEMAPEVREEFRAPERMLLGMSLERCKMEFLPEVQGDPSGERCSGEMICNRCGQEYYAHPMDWRVIGYGNVPFLNILCDGTRVKL